MACPFLSPHDDLAVAFICFRFGHTSEYIFFNGHTSEYFFFNGHTSEYIFLMDSLLSTITKTKMDTLLSTSLKTTKMDALLSTD